MTDPSPDTAPSSTPPLERERIEPASVRRRLDLLPLVYLLGFVVLAGAVAYLWRNPAIPAQAVQEAARVNTLDQWLQALAGRVQSIEARPAPTQLAAPAPDLGPLEARIAALEGRSVAAAAPDLGPLETRISALESRPVPVPPPAAPEPATQADLSGLATRLDAVAAQQDALTGRQTADAAGLSKRIEALESRLVVAERQAGQVGGLAEQAGTLETRLAASERQAGQVASLADRAGRLARLQSAMAALDAGQKLGPLPDSPPALSRFADTPPPTEAALRLSFPNAADAAHRASQPAITEDQPLLNRMWTRAQQVVTVRQGERVLLGDPIAGVLALARQRLDAGDLAGTLAALDGLAGPARAAMADWIGQARALLDARAALAQMTAQG